MNLGAISGYGNVVLFICCAGISFHNFLLFSFSGLVGGGGMATDWVCLGRTVLIRIAPEGIIGSKLAVGPNVRFYLCLVGSLTVGGLF